MQIDRVLKAKLVECMCCLAVKSCSKGFETLDVTWIAAFGSVPDKLKLFSSSTATDCENAVEHPLERMTGVLGQQLTPYLFKTHLNITVLCTRGKQEASLECCACSLLLKLMEH